MPGVLALAEVNAGPFVWVISLAPRADGEDPGFDPSERNSS